MFGHTYYHSIIRKYIIMFGTMFNDIDVQRFDTAGERIQTLRVPIAYGPKEKFLVRLAQDPNFDRDIAISLPRMSFEITSMNYNSTRKLPSTIKNVYTYTDKDKLKYQYTPVPFDINIALSVFVKNADDGVQILEGILPFFTPEWTNSVNLIPELKLKMDVPVVFNDISTEDTYEGDFSTRRALIHTLNFTVKGYLFGPVRTQGVIKRAVATTNIETTDGSSSAISSILTATPGLTANGTPTTDSTITVPPEQISSTDDYGFIEDQQFFSGGTDSV
jgi:hypothetical protein